MSDPAAEAARDLLARARAAAEEMTTQDDVSEEDIAVEVSVEIENLEHDASGNISRGIDPAIEYAFVEAVKGHLKSWGY
ncbi:MAG: hypothetical protein ABGY10_03900 [bacterium]|nr:MAG: hypothetical protein CXT65_05015 [Euryarchaeota archaeon]